MEYYLYILYSKKLDRYYTGVSRNPSQRLISHNEYPKGWTKHGVPWELVFMKAFVSKTEAQYWERFIKRQKKRSLIEKIIRGEFHWEK